MSVAISVISPFNLKQSSRSFDAAAPTSPSFAPSSPSFAPSSPSFAPPAAAAALAFITPLSLTSTVHSPSYAPSSVSNKRKRNESDHHDNQNKKKKVRTCLEHVFTQISGSSVQYDSSNAAAASDAASDHHVDNLLSPSSPRSPYSFYSEDNNNIHDNNFNDFSSSLFRIVSDGYHNRGNVDEFKSLISLIQSQSSQSFDINIKDSDGLTALHYCIINDHHDLLDHLLAVNNINVNVQDNQGNTPLHYAITKYTTVLLSKLLSHPHHRVNVYIKNKDGFTAMNRFLHGVIQYKSHDVDRATHIMSIIETYQITLQQHHHN